MLDRILTVEQATISDIPAWIALAEEVEPLFGPLVYSPDFLSALDRNIARGSAFCIHSQDSLATDACSLLGGVLFSSHPPHYRIGWLAVARRYRRRGVGLALMRHAICLIRPPAELSVVTFGEDVPDGEPARQFYRSLGFQPAAPAPSVPGYGSRMMYILHIR